MNFFYDTELAIGFTKRSILTRLFEGGDVDVSEVQKFYSGVRAFYRQAFKYARERLPFSDEVIINASWVDCSQRLSCS
jgi:hypothetical protein